MKRSDYKGKVPLSGPVAGGSRGVERVMKAIPATVDDFARGIEMSDIPATADDFNTDNPATDMAQQLSVCMPKPRTAWKEAHEDAETWLLILLEGLHVHVHKRADRRDNEVLHFCLRHLFESSGNLYRILLPELTTWTATLNTSERQACAYGIWSTIQSIGCLLERLGALCQLLNGTICNVLDILDSSCSIYSKKPVKKQSESVQWQCARMQVGLVLQKWEIANRRRLRFAEKFAHQQGVMPALEQIDPALDLYLENTCVLFGTILPAIQGIPRGDDSVLVVCLLDMQQRLDQLFVQINLLFDPLHEVMKQYTAEEELQ